jgi:hypothetical protein
MKTVSRTLFAVLVVLAGVAVLAASWRWFDGRIRHGMTVALEHKSVQHSPGRVLSLTALAPGDTLKRGTQLYRLCFSIQSSSEIAAEDRSEYQGALNRPFCRSTQNPDATKLKVGDGLAIGYLLENEGQISEARIEVSGQSIYP